METTSDAIAALVELVALNGRCHQSTNISHSSSTSPGGVPSSRRDRTVEAEWQACRVDDSDFLARLCGEIATRIGTRAACLEAVALSIVVAKGFGVQLRPQPVSIWAAAPGANQWATGKRALDFAVSSGTLLRITEHRATTDATWFQLVGHMVAVSDEHRLILDPAFGQFSLSGIPNRAVCARMPRMDLIVEEAWCVNEPDRSIRYWPVNDIDGWQLELEKGYLLAEAIAPEIERSLRS